MKTDTNRGGHWTGREEKQLKMLIEQGHSYKKVAKALKRSVVSVRKHVYYMRRHGRQFSHGSQFSSENPRRPWTDEDIKVLKELIAKGSPYQEVAFALNRSYYSVKCKMHTLYKAGTAKEKAPRWSFHEIGMLKQYIRKPCTKEDIEKLRTTLGRSRDSILGKIQRIRKGAK